MVKEGKEVTDTENKGLDNKSKDIKKDREAGKSNKGKECGDSIQVKYNKLKKKHRYLRDEYTKVLESWELSVKQLKMIIEERK